MLYTVLVLMMTIGSTTVFATNDPIAVVNNLSEFIFGLIRAIGMILLGFGIVQVGLSLKSHDPSQRVNGFLFCINLGNLCFIYMHFIFYDFALYLSLCLFLFHYFLCMNARYLHKL